MKVYDLSAVPPEEVEKLDHEWMDGEHMRLLPAAEFRKVPHAWLQAWCHKRARYSVPTAELVTWLRDTLVINGHERVIEIGAGMGDLAHHLGIPATDSAVQEENPHVRMAYFALNQPIVAPPKCVVRMDAAAAIEHYRPDAVIAAWVTERYDAAIHGSQAVPEAFYLGVDEMALLGSVKAYYFIGNTETHFKKHILSQPHNSFNRDWLISRASAVNENGIWVFSGGRK